MNIETKFNKEDEVYFMVSNKVQKGIIVGILITIGEQRKSEKYIHQEPRYNLHIQAGTSYEAWSESNIFKTKEELLNSL